MRRLISLLLFPISLFSQELPDSTIAAGLGVKKLIILVCYDSIPCDTHDVFVLEGSWKNANGIPPMEDQIRDTSRHKIVYDQRGRIIFSGPKKDKLKHCWVDSAYCRTYRYDNKNRLIAETNYTCEKGKNEIFYQYDKNGKMILKTWYPRPDIPVTREEYSYNKEGKLDSVVAWWAMRPENPVRDSSDTKSYRIIYMYENGLINGAIADDPSRNYYALFIYWIDPDHGIETSSRVVYHYIYVY